MSVVEPIGVVEAARARLQRRALGLEYGTIAWNVGEAVLTISLGAAAGSLALIGFGADDSIVRGRRSGWRSSR